MLIVSTILSLVGLLLNLIGVIGLYKNRANMFGSVSISDIRKLNKQLTENPENADDFITKDILKKVTKANDFFICIVVGFMFEFFAVGLTIYSIISHQN